jgi:hypothetical protein
VVVNIIGADNPACAPLLGSVHASYAGAFSRHVAFGMESNDLKQLQNVIAAYSDANMQWLSVLNPLARPLPGGMVLTDNLAPLERLSQQCRLG